MYSKLVLAFALILISASTSAQELPEIIDSGSCGENEGDCNWSVDATGKLIIWGGGDMKDYNFDAPWLKYNANINQIELSGITKIGYAGLWALSHVKDLTIPATVEELGSGSLQGMTNLSTLTFEEGSHLKRIKGSVFQGTPNLQKLELPESLEYLGSGNQFYNSGVASLVLPETLFKEDGSISTSGQSMLQDNMVVYCPKEHQKQCEDYIKNAIIITGKTDEQGNYIYVPLQNMTLQTYEKDGDGYFINGSWYQKPNDVLTGKHIKKLRYTVEEAMKATEKGDKFHVFLTYK